jgi:hypothetical protein
VSLAPAVDLLLSVALLLGGIPLERRARRVGPLVRVPHAVRLLLVGGALGGPWLLADAGLLPAVPLVGSPVVPLALALAAYLAATVLVGHGTGGASGCRESNAPDGR